MADGSDEPHVVDPMVALARDGADVVSASRYMRGGRPGRRAAAQAADEPDRRADPPLVRRRPDPRPDQQLQALLAALPRLGHDREHGRLRARARADRQGHDRRPPRRRGARRPGATGPPARATSSCASGCRTTCTGIGRPSRARWLAAAPMPAGRIDGSDVALARIGLPAWFVVHRSALDRQAGGPRRSMPATTSARRPPGWPAATRGRHEGAVSTTRAGPHTLLFYAPTSLLPLAVSVAVWMALGLAASVWLVRRSKLPIWWLAVPAARPLDLERQPADDRARAARARRTIVRGGRWPSASSSTRRSRSSFRPAHADRGRDRPARDAAVSCRGSSTCRRARRLDHLDDGLERQRLAVPDPARARRSSALWILRRKAPSGTRSRPSGPPPSSTTWRWRCRRSVEPTDPRRRARAARATHGPDRGDGPGRAGLAGSPAGAIVRGGSGPALTGDSTGIAATSRCIQHTAIAASRSSRDAQHARRRAEPRRSRASAGSRRAGSA